MIQNLLSFDKLIGITLFSIVSLLGGLMMMTRDFGMGIGTVVMSVVGFAVGIVFWRFTCEIYMLFFRISDDLRDIKNDRLGLTPNTTDV